MAIIQNSKIIQKLIDELELYPALDKVPTELAEKILPVFQVNAEEMNVILKKNAVKYQNTTLNIQDKTFTVPDGKQWTLLWAAAQFLTTATVGNRMATIMISDETGQTIMRIVQLTVPIVASRTADYLFMQGHGAMYADQDKNYSMFISIPKDLVLLEKYTIQFLLDDAAGTPIDVTDDMITTIMVDEQDVN